MPSLTESSHSEDQFETAIWAEINAISLVRQNTDIPTPQIHAFEVGSNNSVNVPFMLMDCLDGNVGMDLDLEIQTEYKEAFFNDVARIHVSKASIKIQE